MDDMWGTKPVAKEKRDREKSPLSKECVSKEKGKQSWSRIVVMTEEFQSTPGIEPGTVGEDSASTPPS